MYRCQICRAVVGPREPRRTVTQTYKTGRLAGSVAREIPCCVECDDDCNGAGLDPDTLAAEFAADRVRRGVAHEALRSPSLPRPSIGGEEVAVLSVEDQFLAFMDDNED